MTSVPPPDEPAPDAQRGRHLAVARSQQGVGGALRRLIGIVIGLIVMVAGVIRLALRRRREVEAKEPDLSVEGAEASSPAASEPPASASHEAGPAPTADEDASSPAAPPSVDPDLAALALARASRHRAAMASEPALDAAALDHLRSLGLVEDLSKTYPEDAVAVAEGLAEAVAAGDAEAIEIAAHTLKGSSATIGAFRAATLCSDLERAARGKSMTMAGEILAELRAELDRVGRALVEAAAEGGGPPG